jgi:HTH-type transcriptional regulator/antitoxin HigA
MNEKSFQPEWMSAPGGTIADILTQQKLTVDEFAELMHYSQERVGKLLSGREAITTEVAKLLESKIGGSARFWMSREEQYRDDVGRLQSEGNGIAANVWLSELPVNDMIKLGWLTREASAESKVAACLQFFGVPNVSVWREKYRDVLSVVLFRTSPTFESQPGAVLAWLRYGEIKSMQVECKPWNAKRFASELLKIRKLTRAKDPDSFVSELRRICADCGVALVIARTPSGCRASGATRFISSKKAMILLSFRYLSDDQFWFTFFHEAGHLLLHNDKAIFIEDGSDVTLDEENEANNFAENLLVPHETRSELQKMPLTKHDIIRTAVKIGISRGIVVGQLQHMKRIRPSQFNWMKRRYNWNQINF